MLYTDKNIYVEKKLYEKIGWLVKRAFKKKQDNPIIIDGDTGTGKTTIASEVAYVYAYVAKKYFNVDISYKEENLFFDPDKMLQYGINSKQKIVHWDELALAGLSKEWYKKVQINFIKLLLVGRKKNHLYLMCVPKFQDIKSTIIMNSRGLIHTYQTRGEKNGYFYYYSQKAMRAMYADFIQHRRKMPLYDRYKTFRGTFPNKFEQIINQDWYDGEKDKAILSITDVPTKSSKYEVKFRELVAKVAHLHEHIPGLTQQKLYEYLGIPQQTISRHKNTQLKTTNTLENDDFYPLPSVNIITNGKPNTPTHIQEVVYDSTSNNKVVQGVVPNSISDIQPVVPNKRGYIPQVVP